MNPYAATETASTEETKPTPNWPVLIMLASLASYGTIRLMEDLGIIISRNGELEVWIEEDFRKWMRSK